MKEFQERMGVLFKGRLVVVLVSAIALMIVAFLHNPAIFARVAIIMLFECTLNQPYLWSRQQKVKSVGQARTHLYLDIIVVSLLVHYFGGHQSGPIIVGYFLLMFFSSVVIRPLEGFWIAGASLAMFFIMVVLEDKGVIAGYPALAVAGGEQRHIAAAILATALIFLLLAYSGYYIHKVLAEQEQKLLIAVTRGQRIVKEAKDAIIIINHDGTVFTANPSSGRLFQFDPEKIIGEMFTEVLSPETADDFAVLIQNVSTGERVAGKNLPLVLRDGSEKIVEVLASPYARDPDPPGAFILLRDITDQQRMEAKLKLYSEELELRVEARTAELEESWESYATLFERAAVPLCWLDPEAVLQSANRSFYQLTGLDKDVEGSLSLVDILADEADKKTVTEYLDLLRRGYDAPTRVELTIKPADELILFTEWFFHFEPLTDQHLISIIDITEAKIAEEKVAESEERYRRLVETIPDGVILVDLEGKVLVVNRQGLKFYGVESEDELIGLNAFDLIAEKHRALAIENMQTAFKEGSIKSFEYEFLKKDGSTYIGEISASLVRDAEGAPQAFIGMVRDVSQRKRLEKSLKESEVRYRTLFEKSRDAVFITTRQGDFVNINQAMVDLFGYPREELLGLYVRKIYTDPADRKKFRKEIEEKGSVKDYEIRFKKKDGTVMDCLLTSTVRRADDKTVLGYQGIIRDITESKRAQEALRESEAKLRFLIEHSPDFIVTIDRDGEILFINRTLEYQSMEEVVGQSAYDFLPPEYHDQARETLNQALDSKEPISYKTVSVRGIYIECRIVPLKSDGQAQSVMVIGTDVTERKQAEEALRFTQFSVDHAADAAFWMGPDASFIYVNDAACGSLGYTREELLSMNVFDIDPDFPKEAWPDHWRELKERGTFSLESRHRDKNGRVFPVEITVNFVEFEGKEYNCAFVRDITERLRAEESLKESEQLLRAVVSKSPVMLFALDKDGIFTLSEGKGLEALGLKPGQIVGMSVMDAYGDMPETKKNLSRALAGEEVNLAIEMGGLVFECWYHQLLDQDGNVTGVIGVATDITDRKRAQDALKESEERYRLLAENVTDVIWTSDMQLSTTYISPSVEAMRGYTVEETLTQTPKDLVTPEFYDFFMKSFAEELALEKLKDKDPHRSRILEVEQRCKDGSTIWVEIKASFLRDQEGRPIGVLGITRDISERKRTEEEQQALRDQLVQIEQMAAVGQMAAGMVHEMNSPIMAITYYTQALEKLKALKKKDRENINRIHESAQRIQRLLNGLTSYASAEKIEFEPVDLNTIIPQVLDSISHETEQRPKAKVKTRLSSKLKPVSGSAEQLFHLVSNLVCNALQSLPENKGEIKISTKMKDGMVELEVKDTGTGIKDKDMPYIFNPFFTRRKDSMGTGLGLAIVHRVAKLHQGEVEVESEPGKGTTFKVKFPAGDSGKN